MPLEPIQDEDGVWFSVELPAGFNEVFGDAPIAVSRMVSFNHGLDLQSGHFTPETEITIDDEAIVNFSEAITSLGTSMEQASRAFQQFNIREAIEQRLQEGLEQMFINGDASHVGTRKDILFDPDKYLFLGLRSEMMYIANHTPARVIHVQDLRQVVGKDPDEYGIILGETLLQDTEVAQRYERIIAYLTEHDFYARFPSSFLED